MSKDIFLENAMGERNDQLDYWYFIDEMPVVDAPTDSAETQFIFERGNVLLVRHYLQNVYGIWGYYDVRTPRKTVRRYILLHNDEGYLAAHKIIPIR